MHAGGVVYKNTANLMGFGWRRRWYIRAARRVVVVVVVVVVVADSLIVAGMIRSRGDGGAAVDLGGGFDDNRDDA